MVDSVKSWLNSPEGQFLIYCSRTSLDDQTKEALKTLSASGLNWSGIVSKATRQGVAQFLYFHLSGWEEIWSVIPAELKDRLKQCYYGTLSRNWMIQRELSKVIEILDRTQIDAIVLKGAALLETVYENVALRSMSDVDLLVKKNDLSRARSILEEAGYEKPDFLDQDSLEKFGCEIRLYKKGGIFLDIHSNLYQYERFKDVFKIDFDGEIWNDSTLYKTREGQLRILNPTHLIMHLCLHQALAHFFAGLFRFCDLRETILTHNKDINWRDFVLKTRHYKIKKVVYYCLEFVQDLFGQIVPNGILHELRPNRIQSTVARFFVSKNKILSFSDLELISKKYVSQLFLVDKFWDTPKIVAKGLFPSNEWLRHRYGIKRTAKLIAYRLFHPLITVFNILS